MQYLLAQGIKGSTNQQSSEVHPDPTIYCTSFNKHRFYCLSRREPNSIEDRDVFNELPTADKLGNELIDASKQIKKDLEKEAVLRTTAGDIAIRLYGDECPKTVENFLTHAKNGYYDGIIFHRVIKGFMLQTGDPKGDGTGGESIWGGEFEDEFVDKLKHNLPYTVSMANAGPNTNGSQFFITVAATPHLDNKHTVFGRVTLGQDVCNNIENTKTDKFDTPLSTIKILSIDIN